MALTDTQIVELVNTEMLNAIGKPGGDISKERARALEYYMRKLYGNEEEGSSAVVTSDVSEVIDGQMPGLLRMFTTQDNLVSFDPVGKATVEESKQDEKQAEQETDYISHIFFKRNPSFEIMFFWMFDALVQKTGYVKAFFDDAERFKIESYRGLSDIEAMALLDDEELEPIEREERVAQVASEDGTITEQPVHDIRFRRTQKKGRFAVENVPPEEIRISNDARSLDLCKARMVAHERHVTRDELLAMGFSKKVVEGLPGEDRTTDTTEKLARRDKSDDRSGNSGEPNADPSQDLILLQEVYMHLDQDEDGRSELKQIFIADNKMLEINDADRQPFHAICPHPIPHKHVGMASAEKVMDNQVITSTVLRQTLDNLYQTNNPGKILWEQAEGETTMDDLLTRRVGRIAKVKRPVNEAIADDVVPFTAGQSFAMLEYFDKSKRDRTGVNADSEGLSPVDLKHIQTSVMAQANDISKMKLEGIARIFAETGFKSLFMHLHELVLKHQDDAEYVRLRGEWVQVDPRTWRTRDDMTVNIGLGIGTREQNMMHLEAIRAIQAQMAEGGGMNLTVTPQNIYQTAVEVVKNANYKRPEMFFTDPGDQKAPPPSDEQMQLQQQQMQLQQQQQQLDAQRQEIDKAKLQLQNQEQQAQHQREMLKIEESRESRLDKTMLENEKLRNALAEMGIKVNAAEAETLIKSLSAQAQAELSAAQAEQARALARKTTAETAVVGQVDLGDAARKQRETDAKVSKTEAEIEKIRKDIEKTGKEIEAEDVQIQAAKSGLSELDDGGPDESE